MPRFNCDNLQGKVSKSSGENGGRTLIFLFVSLLKSTVQWKEIEADELKAEKEIVAWLDKLGYQELSKAAVVNVATGN